jgi:hypothetical protein
MVVIEIKNGNGTALSPPRLIEFSTGLKDKAVGIAGGFF